MPGVQAAVNAAIAAPSKIAATVGAAESAAGEKAFSSALLQAQDIEAARESGAEISPKQQARLEKTVQRIPESRLKAYQAEISKMQQRSMVNRAIRLESQQRAETISAAIKAIRQHKSPTPTLTGGATTTQIRSKEWRDDNGE